MLQGAVQPPSHTVGQDALGGASVEGAHDGDKSFGSSQSAEEIEALLSVLEINITEGKYPHNPAITVQNTDSKCTTQEATIR